MRVASAKPRGCRLADILAVMAAPISAEDFAVRSLDLGYSDVVAFLNQAHEDGAMEAPLVLEPVQFMPAPGERPSTPGGPETDIILPKIRR